MAGKLLKTGNYTDADIREYCVDTIDEVRYLPTTTTKGTGIFAGRPGFEHRIPMGSTCIVGNGDSDVLVYMLFSNGWKPL